MDWPLWAQVTVTVPVGIAGVLIGIRLADWLRDRRE